MEPIQDIAIQGGELRFRRGGESFKARREGEELSGEAAMKDGKKFAFAGRRADEMCDVGGTWKVRRAGGKDSKSATLALVESAGKITGTATDPDCLVYEIGDAKLDGYTLTLEARPKGGDGPPRKMRCEVRGDTLVGKAKVKLPGKEETQSVDLEGKRERMLGEPVALLAKDSLAGWSSRDLPAPHDSPADRPHPPAERESLPLRRCVLEDREEVTEAGHGFWRTSMGGRRRRRCPGCRGKLAQPLITA